jgi:cyclin-dependent kinase 12/13
MLQILQGIQYLHSSNVIHRDIKGANILISSAGEVKLADFGLARVFYPGNEKVNYTNKVVTLWYRAPELLLGSRNYTQAVDMWSVGCVFAELVLQQVLFRGDKEERQIELIYEKCGSVSNENWPGV